MFSCIAASALHRKCARKTCELACVLDSQTAIPQDIELRKPKKQLEFIWRGSSLYGPWGDLWTYAMETGVRAAALFQPCDVQRAAAPVTYVTDSRLP